MISLFISSITSIVTITITIDDNSIISVIIIRSETGALDAGAAAAITAAALAVAEQEIRNMNYIDNESAPNYKTTRTHNTKK